LRAVLARDPSGYTATVASVQRLERGSGGAEIGSDTDSK
jgi:hypothetical protein